MLKLDHVVFPVRDAEKTLAFYRDVMRLPLIATHTGDDWDGFAWMMLIFGLGGGQDLDRYAAAVLEVLGQIDQRHATAPDLALDPVAATQRLV